ncbi:MAG TPA: TIGR03089 family protein, partial [Mycobacteriales bacterium]|nr:TIGR03089 family protein [Mycobacteriales bacterium]
DPSRPLITWYDDATGERVELSVATTANWVAKTANLLRDTLDVHPGDRVAVALPRHWQTPVVQLAGWLAGASVVAVELGSALPAGLAAGFVSEAALDAGLVVPRGVEVVALSLRPMAGRLATERPGVLDFAVEVPGHGDHFAPGPDGDLDLDLVERATALGLSAGDRALVRLQPWTPDGLVATGLAPLLAGAGVLICSGDDVPQSRLDAERVTRTLG